MCGISGFLSDRAITLETLRKMNNTMIHRGPDDEGAEIYPLKDGRAVGFAQRRLAIQDLSPMGHQPMHSQDQRVSVIFNGEIYNFKELRQELSEYDFRSTCDTEVILAAYLHWGPEFVNRIHGMFAIALFDRQEEKLFLIRDRIGKKPLYYWKDGANIVFASELKPIMACPYFRPEIRREILPRFLFQQYINAPETVFRDVFHLLPGSVMEIPLSGGEPVIRKYWDIREVYRRESLDPVEDYETAKAELKERLKRAVARRMIADVPLGTFLSGGYDSSLVTAMAQEHSERPVRTFTIGFPVKEFNEAVYAKEISEYLGTDHTELYIDEAEMLRLVESIPKYFDEPFADSSQIPTMLVSSLAKKDVTVALSGDAGDEFFCGYNIYDNVAQAQKLDLAGSAAYALGRLPIGGGKHLLDKMPLRVRVVAGNRDPETKVQFASDSYILSAHAFIEGRERFDTRMSAASYLAADLNAKGADIPIKYPVESLYGVKDWQVRRMLLDMDTYLPGDILCKMDRAAMKYSLEARCPIMDTEVMEYSFRIPQRFKYMDGDKKHILKDIACDYIPKRLLDRPKTGFGVPLDEWMRGPLKEKLLDYCSADYLTRQGIFDTDYVTGFVGRYLEKGDGGPATGANYSKLVWSFFVFQQWYDTYME